MKELKMLFENKEVEILTINGNAMFEIYSTGMALGYVTKAKNKDYPHKSRVDKTLKNAEISTVVHGVQLYMTENQLYDFMLEAHTEKCKSFRKWVTSEVVPQIKLTGGYVETDRESEFITNYFPSFADETKLGMVQDLLKSNAEYKLKIAELEPDAELAKSLMNAQGCLSLKQVADNIEVGRTKLCTLLRKAKVLSKQSGYNEPMGKYITSHYFKTIVKEDEKENISIVTVVTAKGLKFIYRLIKKNDMLDEFNTSPLQEVSTNA